MNITLMYLTDYPPTGAAFERLAGLKTVHGMYTKELITSEDTSTINFLLNKVRSLTVPHVLMSLGSVDTVRLLMPDLKLRESYHFTEFTLRFLNWEEQKQRMDYLKLLQITG